MAAQEQHHKENPQAPQKDEDSHELDPFKKLFTSYLGLSFTLFLGLLPKNTLTLLSTLRRQNKALAFKLMQAEDELNQLHYRRKEDSKANARVVEIYASHRHAWQQEEKRLLQQIDEGGEEIAYLKGKIEEFEGIEAELKANIEGLKREIGERDEMLNFLSRNGEESYGGDMGFGYGKSSVSVSEQGVVDDDDEIGSVIYGESGDNVGDNGNRGFGAPSSFLDNSASAVDSKFWSEKASLWQDMQCETLESHYHSKHFITRRESPWKVDGDSTGISSKLKLLEQELQNLERIVKDDLSKMPSQLRKQAKRYQSLAEKIDNICRRMQASDPCDSTLSSEFRAQRQTEFLIEAFRLQQRASETNQKLMSLQNETGKNCHGNELEDQAKLATRRSLGSIRNNFKEIQRNLEIWLARIIGDLEGILARSGATRVGEYYVSRPLHCLDMFVNVKSGDHNERKITSFTSSYQMKHQFTSRQT